jgi:3-deoxy-manno-octulosonate cytidylyltransferase (CMP-KDO synthetase)
MNIGIIPARYNSSRFPGKPLIDISGKTMIQRVYEQSLKAELIDKVIVATDDWRIFEHVLSWGGEVSMTSSSHVSGTERCAEVAKYNQDASIIVNIQGDEPFIDPAIIDQTVLLLKKNPGFSISTMCAEILRADDIYDPNLVKVVFNQLKKALYFSRSPIPHVRNTPYEEWLSNDLFYKHIGIYGYRHAALMEIAQLPHGKMENAEMLEQLRWLEAGYEIGIGITDKESISIDTPEDLLKIQII